MKCLLAYVTLFVAVVRVGHSVRDVERRIDDLGDRLDFGAQFFLDAMQIEAILVGD